MADPDPLLSDLKISSHHLTLISSLNNYQKSLLPSLTNTEAPESSVDVRLPSPVVTKTLAIPKGKLLTAARFSLFITTTLTICLMGLFVGNYVLSKKIKEATAKNRKEMPGESLVMIIEYCFMTPGCIAAFSLACWPAIYREVIEYFGGFLLNFRKTKWFSLVKEFLYAAVVFAWFTVAGFAYRSDGDLHSSRSRTFLSLTSLSMLATILVLEKVNFRKEGQYLSALVCGLSLFNLVTAVKPTIHYDLLSLLFTILVSIFIFGVSFSCKLLEVYSPVEEDGPTLDTLKLVIQILNGDRGAKIIELEDAKAQMELKTKMVNDLQQQLEVKAKMVTDLESLVIGLKAVAGGTTTTNTTPNLLG